MMKFLIKRQRKKDGLISMDNKKALNMLGKVVSFMSDYGGLPAIKQVDDRTLKAERRLRNKLIRLQAGVEAEFIRELRRRGYLPGDNKARRSFISEILGVPFEQMKTVIADESVEGAELGRQLAFEDLAEAGMEVAFEKIEENVKEKLWEKTYQFSEDTFSRIEGDFIQTLTDGYDNGLGIDEVAAELRDDFKGLRDHRLENIARTEIQSAQNEGADETMKEYGVRYKQWLTVGDDRVRGNNPNDEYDHIHLHGQVVEFDEPYSNGLMHPGDRDGDIGDWINCRCRQRPYIPRKGETVMVTPYYP